MNNIITHIAINSIDELPEKVKELEHAFNKCKVVAFFAPMGAGKTTIIKALCKQMGVTDNISSPTFSIINEYHTPTSKIYHFDFYRIKSINEAYDMGYEDYFYSNHYCFIEWPEKIEELLPQSIAKVKIKVNENGQRLVNIETPAS